MKAGSVESHDGTILLSQVTASPIPRLRTGPWDGNFGKPDGVPTTSVTVLGGAPGVGKSTVTLQFSDAIIESPEVRDTNKEVILLGAEENEEQVLDRGIRLGLKHLDRIRVVKRAHIQDVQFDQLLLHPACAFIIDSIPGFTNDPLEACELVGMFKNEATRLRIPFIVINHITKDGDQAGLKKLQHAGDISLIMNFQEGVQDELFRFPKNDRIWTPKEMKADGRFGEIAAELRDLSTSKSRFGPSGVETCYLMTERRGLVLVERVEDDELEEMQEG